jgi:Toastrack DUF4097
VSSGDIELRDGRQVSARQSAGGQSGPGIDGAIPVRLVASSLAATVTVLPTASSAYALITGDGKDEVAIGWQDGMWTLEWPENAGVTVINGDFGGVVIGNGSVQFNSYSNGRSTTIISGSAGPDSSAVHLYVPSGSDLAAELRAGRVHAPAAADARHGLHAIDFSSSSAELVTECAVGSITFQSSSGDLRARGITGPVSAQASSGDISVPQAMGSVRAHTSSGDVRVHAMAGIVVDVHTSSGDIDITKAPGSTPRVRTRTSSGSVRKP